MEKSYLKHQDFLVTLAASLMSPLAASKVMHPTIGATLKAWQALFSHKIHKENLHKLDIPVKTYEWLIEGFDARD